MALLSEIIPNLTGPQGAPGSGSQGNQGHQGNIGNQGEIGNQGSIGNQGLRGLQGFTGDKGGLRYDFLTATTMADPGTGWFKFNNTDITNVTQIAIDDLTQESANVREYILSWDDSTSTVKGHIIVKSNIISDTTYCIFQLNSLVANSGWVLFNVNYISGTLPSSQEPCVIEFSRVGDKGDSSLGYTPYEIWGEYTYNNSSGGHRMFSLQFDSNLYPNALFGFYYKLELYANPYIDTPTYYGKYEIQGYIMGFIGEDPVLSDYSWRVHNIDFHRTNVGDSVEGIWYKDPTLSGNNLRLNWIHHAVEFYSYGFRLLVYPINAGEYPVEEMYDYINSWTIIEAATGSQSGYYQSQQIHSGLILSRSLEDFEALSQGRQSYAERALDVRGDGRFSDKLYLDTLHTDSSGYQGLLGKHSSKAVADVVVGDGLDLTIGGNIKTKTYSTTVGDGSATQFTLTHGYTLSTGQNLITSIYEVSSGEQIFTQVEVLNTTQIRVTFGVAPTTNQYRVVVMMI